MKAQTALPVIIFLPVAAGLLSLCLPKSARKAAGFISLVITAAILAVSVKLFMVKSEVLFTLPWVGMGAEFILRAYHFSKFILLASAGFSFLIALYSLPFMSGKDNARQFFAYLLITFGFVNGAVLADNLLLLIFFWEGLLVTLFAMIAIGGKGSFKTATKALIISGVTDLCLMFGIVLTARLAGTMTISQINLPLATLSSAAFVFLMIGAISKAGSMPFHTWIPDAAVDAPLPFMAFLPAALEKLLGIYMLSRISLDMFQLHEHHWLSYLMMTVGAITILLAVMMALIQKDYKRLLSYHAISQVGYMILGIGTMVPVGIVGGIFHMINHAMYKSCLFLTGGSVEKQAGTTDLSNLGGLARKMPITFICFAITAASISGAPPFNGFFSKELIYDGALDRGLIFYMAAVLGSFFTAASFLKLGHAAYFGKIKDENRNVKEAPPAMLIPMIIIAGFCVLFGVYNYLPLTKLIEPILGEHRLEGHVFYGMPSNIKLVLITIVVILGAIGNHIFGVKMKGSGLKAVDHIHYSPVLVSIYDKAEQRFFDPYEIGLKIMNVIATLSFKTDRAVDWIYNVFSVKTAVKIGNETSMWHRGNYSIYIVWIMLGTIAMTLFLVYSK